MPSPEMLALIAATFFCAGFVKGVIGLGLPLVVLGALAAPLGLKEAMALMLLPSVCSNLWQGFAGPALGDILRRFRTFFLAALAGIWIGVGILAAAPDDLLLGILGLLLCAYTGITLSGPTLPPPRPERERWYGPAAGGIGGVIFGMSGVFIVPGILYLQILGLKRDTLVQAMGVTFVIISAALAAFMTGRHLMPLHLASLSALALLPTFAGLVIGQRYRQRISEDAFRRLILIALFVIGLSLFARAVL